MAPPFFRDPKLQEQFVREGYVVMPLLSADQAKALRDWFFELHEQLPDKGFYASSFSPDADLKNTIFEKVETWVGPAVETHFEQIKKLGTSFLMKKPGPSGHMPIHQDWTVTDEQSTLTATIWIPLQEVNAHNGAIKVLPGSHRFSYALRSPTLPVIYQNVFPLLEEKLITLEMKAGEAFIFHHNLLHSSHDNLSEEPRIAMTYGLAPKEAPLCFYHHHAQDPPHRFEKISVPNDFFRRYYQTGQRPDFGTSEGFFQQDLSPISETECKQLLSGELHFLHRQVFREVKPEREAAPSPAFRMLKDQLVNEKLAREGFVIFPFLSQPQIQELTDFFNSRVTEIPNRFYATAHAQDLDFRGAMNQKIREVFAPNFEKLLDQAHQQGGSFIAKPKGSGGLLPPHADWNISDESRFRSFNLWVPLVDTTVENGAVHFLPYSHDWFDSWRGPGLPNSFEPVKDLLWKVLQPLEMKAGHALLYDHRLVHASPVNQSDVLRLACVYGLMPLEAEMRHYCPVPGKKGTLGEYQSNVDFHLKGNPEAGPGELKLLSSTSPPFPLVTASALTGFLQKRAPECLAGLRTEKADERSFWQTYTPGNVAKEAMNRIRKLFS